jgi:hypothetical protein
MLGSSAEGRIRAKTGTLQNVTALSGYAEARGGRKYAFAIMVNDYPGRVSTVIPGVDAIGAAIAGTGTPGAGERAVAFAQPPARDASTPMGELAVRLSTFHELLEKADAANAAFLRTSLRTERDPALRAAIAEALTPHQRRVLVALAVNGVPIDVLAERLNTNRGALYKTLHDARKKLRNHLDERGFALDTWLEDR